jgi:hypothetical protein
MTLSETKLRFACAVTEYLAAVPPKPTAEQRLREVIADLEQIPEARTDKDTLRAFHLLQHYFADEDIRQKDLRYADAQRAGLQQAAQELSSSDQQ